MTDNNVEEHASKNREMNTTSDSSSDNNDQDGEKGGVNHGGPASSSSSQPSSSSSPLQPLSDQLAKISLQEHEGGDDKNQHAGDETKDGDCQLKQEQKTKKKKKKENIPDRRTTILCDAGYGLPREKRPRQEKINAICGQLSNFIRWQLTQQQQQQQQMQHQHEPALIRIVGCCDSTMKSTLEKRLLEQLNLEDLPDHVTISCDELTTSVTTVKTDETHSSDDNENGGDFDAVYLSPDADETLDPTQLPPSTVVVGLIIDRRIQPDRSVNRASSVKIKSKRWPFDSCFVNINKNEPLNVDCIMEAMQQWWWNTDKIHRLDDGEEQEVEERLKHQHREAFIQATAQALEHHADRHPSRSLHK